MSAKISERMMLKYFVFLDDLRKSGVTTMYGATPYLQEAFGIKREAATLILSSWMKTFSDEPAANRAIAAANGEAS